MPRVSRITDLYKSATRYKKAGIHLVCIDEKPGIQANEHLHPALPLKPGFMTRPEQFYTRHGTTCLIGSFEVATGRIVHSTIQPTRSEIDFLEHVKRTIDTAPKSKWIIVTDQLNTHMSESLVRLVAASCGIAGDLGIKGVSGILKNKSTRAAFLEDDTHRIRFAYTPKHCSWLNQIECWFSILARKALRRGSFTSIQALENKIQAFIEYHNKCLAKPFKWTYSGRPLASTQIQ
nr:transposase [Candidatus Sigynarchaeota archaeon]